MCDVTLWDGQEISIKVLHVEQQFIHVLISEKDGQAWEMSAIYADPTRSLGLVLWQQLESITHHLPGCYLVISIALLERGRITIQAVYLLALLIGSKELA